MLLKMSVKIKGYLNSDKNFNMSIQNGCFLKRRVQM